MSDIESRMLKQGLIKVPSDTENESSYRRVAKFLFIIGAEQAATILKQLTKEQIDKVVAELVTIQSIDKQEAFQILNEFQDIYNKNKNSLGGIDTAKTILTEAFGYSKAGQIIENAVPPKKSVPFEYLEDIDSDRLIRILQGELSSAKAIVLSYLKPKQAADYITSLTDESEKKEIILHLAKLKKLDASIVERISEALKKKLADVNLNTTEAIDGVSVLTDILRKTSYQTGYEILSSLENEDKTLVENIKRNLITLDDIANMHPRHIQALLSPMSVHDIAVLIYKQDESFRKILLKNLSKTKAKLVIDEEKYMPPLRKKDRNITVDAFLQRVKTEVEKGNVILIKDEDDTLIY